MFKFRYGTDCDDSKPFSSNKGRARIDTIINASKLYMDNLHIGLLKQIADNENCTIYYHRNCVSRYTSSSNTSKYIKDHPTIVTPATKLRRSHTSFDFFSHCLYCGETCEICKDPKNPNRWRPAYLCRSTVSEQDKTPYKQYLLEKCASRDDVLAEEVRSRVVGSVSDLHAAEARYHRDWTCRFFANVLLSTGNEGGTLSKRSQYQPDMAWKHTVTTLSNGQTRVWNTVELQQEYQDHGGVDLTRSQLAENLCNHFEGDLLIISAPGYANVVYFRCHASTILKMVRYDEDVIENSIRHIAKQVKKECSAIPLDATKYRLNIDAQLAQDSVSCTVQNRLASISTKLENTPPALLLIGNIIASVFRNRPTDLQIALGVLLRDYKTILGYTYDYGITCSYYDILCFKKSAAVVAAKDPSVHGISSAESGLVQTEVDNFDADIHSPNGKLSTHSLAMILTQPSTPGNETDADTIERLKHCDVKLTINEDENDVNVY